MTEIKTPVKLSLRNVSKTFTLPRGSSIDAVHNVSFEVKENEFCVLLGPSGCGKSTILRLIAGLEKSSAGRLTLDGCEIVEPDRQRGMVFQNYTSFDWLSVQKNVEYGMKLNGVSRIERRERANEFIDLVKLNKFKNAFPKQLSGGMKQRVAIARTLANRPQLLLMDEPFGALDAETRWNMQELMISIMESTDTTVVMVTHDIQESLFLAQRIVFISRHPGTVLEDMTTEFKKQARIARKEDVWAMPGYTDMEHRIMAMMREQASDLSNYS
ncbi:MAG: ABC transporter ATP-binding protein [bacterium]|nr:ABC transporter ATP-binding protein [Gammaproteobacteria bacterium]